MKSKLVIKLQFIFRNRTKVLINREQTDRETVVMVTARGSDLQDLW